MNAELGLRQGITQSVYVVGRTSRPTQDSMCLSCYSVHISQHSDSVSIRHSVVYKCSLDLARFHVRRSMSHERTLYGLGAKQTPRPSLSPFLPYENKNNAARSRTPARKPTDPGKSGSVSRYSVAHSTTFYATRALSHIPKRIHRTHRRRKRHTQPTWPLQR